MINFTQEIQQRLTDFSPFLANKIVIDERCFHLKQAMVSEFIQEILQTCTELEQQQRVESVAFYTQRLVEQFNCLTKAIETLEKTNTSTAAFHSPYRFPRNIHHLPKERRLLEYKKALRALNEKLSWLTEKSYQCPNEDKPSYLAALQETEYRKQKCLAAIEKLIEN